MFKDLLPPKKNQQRFFSKTTQQFSFCAKLTNQLKSQFTESKILCKIGFLPLTCHRSIKIRQWHTFTPLCVQVEMLTSDNMSVYCSNYSSAHPVCCPVSLQYDCHPRKTRYITKLTNVGTMTESGTLVSNACTLHKTSFCHTSTNSSASTWHQSHLLSH